MKLLFEQSHHRHYSRWFYRTRPTLIAHLQRCPVAYKADDEYLMCYIYNEMTWAWRPWGFNSELSLVNAAHSLSALLVDCAE